MIHNYSHKYHQIFILQCVMDNMLAKGDIKEWFIYHVHFGLSNVGI